VGGFLLQVYPDPRAVIAQHATTAAVASVLSSTVDLDNDSMFYFSFCFNLYFHFIFNYLDNAGIGLNASSRAALMQKLMRGDSGMMTSNVYFEIFEL